MAFDPLSAAFELGGKLLDHFFPDPSKRAEAQLELLKLQQSGDLAKLTAETSLAQAQIQVNQAEAASPSTFVSGWRPFVGWVCGSGLAYVAIIEPVARFLADVVFGYTGRFPVIDTTLTMQVLLGMLGLAGMRSFEKGKGVAAK